MASRNENYPIELHSEYTSSGGQTETDRQKHRQKQTDRNRHMYGVRSKQSINRACPSAVSSASFGSTRSPLTSSARGSFLRCVHSTEHVLELCPDAMYCMSVCLAGDLPPCLPADPPYLDYCIPTSHTPYTSVFVRRGADQPGEAV